MDMNKAFFLRKEDKDPRWIVIDAAQAAANGENLGRLATRIADILRGKHLSIFTPHTDGGDYVVVINAEKVGISGNKLDTKIYATYSGWMGGLKEKTMRELRDKHPDQIIELAVRRMLPKSKLGRAQIKKLKIYAGAEHPHTAQINTPSKAAR